MPYLVLTECNHADDAFYSLGATNEDEKRSIDAIFSAIPEHAHDCDQDDACYVIDYWESVESGVTQDKEISRATAQSILGVEDFQDLRNDAKAEIKALIELTEGKNA